MKIKEKAKIDRPREKLLSYGAHILSDAELLAIFLRTGVKGKSAIELAQTMLDRFGGIPQLFAADINQFTEIKGVGNTKYAQVHAVLELSKRYLSSKINHSAKMLNSGHTQEYFGLRLRNRLSEVFACLFLDNQNRILSYEELFFGTINYAHVHVREIIRHAIKINAAAIILAHNHPSGDPRPSEADIELTNNVATALDYIDVRLIDHVIVGAGVTASLADLGHINNNS